MASYSVSHNPLPCKGLVISEVLPFLRCRRKNANKKGDAAFHVNTDIICKKSSRSAVILMPTVISSFARSQVCFFPSEIAENEVVMVSLAHATSFLAHLLECNKTQ